MFGGMPLPSVARMKLAASSSESESAVSGIAKAFMTVFG